MSLALSILPVALTMIVGYLICATKLVPKSQWAGIEALSFRLLIPVVLIVTITRSELSLDKFGLFALALILALCLAGVGLLLLRWALPQARLPDPKFTTLFQTTTRWNAFIALAVAELFIGTQGITLIAVAMAVLIPFINLVNISILSLYGTSQATLRTVLLTVLKNPLVQGSLIGLALNFAKVPIPAALLQAMELIGRSAFGIGLLVVGAGINIARLTKKSPAIWFGTIMRLLILPMIFLAIATSFNLTPLQTLSGIFVLSVPAASNGYIVAKQMGGDADLYADILTWQTVLCLMTLPLWAVMLSG
ncbi:MAG: hypothetical protein COB84_10595 [Rhodobacteraceae bacterium]|nr:MAG: hypothetical protein COB84_10595 [Paracoccaceae bacterium]